MQQAEQSFAQLLPQDTTSRAGTSPVKRLVCKDLPSVTRKRSPQSAGQTGLQLDTAVTFILIPLLGQRELPGMAPLRNP